MLSTALVEHRKRWQPNEKPSNWMPNPHWHATVWVISIGSCTNTTRQNACYVKFCAVNQTNLVHLLRWEIFISISVKKKYRLRCTRLLVPLIQMNNTLSTIIDARVT